MKYFVLTIAAFLFAQFSVFGQQSSISAKKLHKHVSYLASDKLKGRGTGTPEERMAANYIAKQFRKIGLTPKGNDGTFFHKFTFKKSSDPHGGVDVSAKSVSAQNVAGYLDNGAEYTIVVGAHYDHLGMGLDHNSLDANPEGKVHNGADDNASGTAGVIELARFLAKNGVKEQHNFLFLCFSGEELGLYGSKKYTETPTIDLTKVSFMINMDMIGRLNAEKKVVVGGVGTAPDFVPTLKNLKSDLGIKLDSAGVGPSDHTSFYLKNIPVLFFFTGQHSDYHKPTDDVEKVNFPGVVQIISTVSEVIQTLDKQPKLKFQETKSKEGTNVSFKVTLGIMPDYTWEGEGVHVDGVTDGKPAAKAGLLKGDIIIGLGDIAVENIQDYMKGLSMFKKGDTTTVKVKRGTEVKTMPVTF
ncbi:MAG: M20/M25/M40 family metallo-hydrolase [Saprospiraceae bacterium]|nr:M20/M25/M40 family metallo-hydrolase [Saprospiraceae bacterium]